MNTARALNLAVFLFFALSLVMKSGYGYGAALLLLLAIVMLVRERPQHPLLREVHILAALFVALALLGFADAARGGLPLSDYELPGKYLLMPVILYALARHAPDARAIWLGAATGALLGAASAFYYQHYAPEWLAMGRASRWLHPIQFGNIAAMLAVLAACGLREAKSWCMRGYLGAGALAGGYAVLLSETRGSLLALLLLGVAVLWRARRRIRPAAWGVALAAGALFWGVGSDTLTRRIADIRADLVLYQQGESATSIGARFELWQFALAEGAAHPVFGAGTVGLRADKAAWLADHPAREFIGDLGHLHNEYLDAFARRGALGLAVLLAALVVPFVFYRRLPPSAARDAGMAHLVLYAGFGLTQSALFGHNSGLHFFTLPLVLLYAVALNGREQNA